MQNTKRGCRKAKTWLLQDTNENEFFSTQDVWFPSQIFINNYTQKYSLFYLLNRRAIYWKSKIVFLSFFVEVGKS